MRVLAAGDGQRDSAPVGCGFPPPRVVLLPGTSRARRIIPRGLKDDTGRMLLPANTSQRDLVRLALLMCGERPSAKHRPAAKGL